jgi:hypothetical protein
VVVNDGGYSVGTIVGDGTGLDVTSDMLDHMYICFRINFDLFDSDYPAMDIGAPKIGDRNFIYPLGKREGNRNLFHFFLCD